MAACWSLYLPYPTSTLCCDCFLAICCTVICTLHVVFAIPLAYAVAAGAKVAILHPTSCIPYHASCRCNGCDFASDILHPASCIMQVQRLRLWRSSRVLQDGGDNQPAGRDAPHRRATSRGGRCSHLCVERYAPQPRPAQLNVPTTNCVVRPTYTTHYSLLMND